MERPKGYTKREIAEIESDGNYWHEFCDAVGWKLVGFTYRDHAGINTGSQMPYRGGFSITGKERYDIMAAIERARGGKK
jgi:hypothetical protein